jgi:RNA polymerase sigma factor (sigma-70 family)
MPPPARLDALLWAALPYRRRDPRPDAELLARFLDHRDEAAFEALVVRHTPAVRAACRGWLRSAADVDDAAQATFLVLVQRGRSIRDRAALGRWLYGVAANVARRLRGRRAAFGPVPDDVPGREPPAADDGLRDLLAEEVGRLPEKYRLPVQLCYWAGLTTAEAAARLGWPRGTVLTRLAWARGRLQKTLARRGVAPAAVAAGLAGATVPPASAKWVCGTARAAKALRAGESPAAAGASGRAVALTEGVVRAMTWDRLKYVALAALVAVGGIGFGFRPWAAASDKPGDGHRFAAGDADPRGPRVRESADPPAAGPKADDGKPGSGGRRREAVIRLPAGTFVKEVDAAPYGSGRLTWTYEDERVQGLIEGSVMGVEFEVTTEAEYSLSSNGTIYGILTSVRVTHLRLPEGGELGEALGELRPFVGLWPAVEPVVNEVTTDLPFSYQFRLQGDRLIISNFRMLLAGPNPLGKLGGLAAGEDIGAALTAFQALGTAIEGTYAAPDARDKPAPARRPLFVKPRGRTEAKPNK